MKTSSNFDWELFEEVSIKSVIFLIFESRVSGISWKGVLVIYIIMGSGRPKGVKDIQPRTGNTTLRGEGSPIYIKYNT
jgi:hypothetical protein